MPNNAKQAVVADLQEKAGRAKSVVFANYTGMNVAQQVKLRQQVKKAGGEVAVAKNRLVNIALGKKPGMTEMLEEQLMTLFSYEDEVGAVKALAQFIKDNEKPVIVGGVLEDRVISAKEVEALSKMPGKSELVAMLLNRLQTPGQNLRNVFEAVPASLVRVLNAVASKQQ